MYFRILTIFSVVALVVGVLPAYAGAPSEMLMFSSGDDTNNLSVHGPVSAPFVTPIVDVCNNVGGNFPQTDPVFVVPPLVFPPNSWKPTLDIDPNAEWISTTADPQAGLSQTALYFHDFIINTPIFSASIEFHFLIDNDLGDGDDPGLLLNCDPVHPAAKKLSVPPGNTDLFQIDNMVGPFDITSILNPGPNTLNIYTADIIPVAFFNPSGVQYKAKISFEPCAPDEELFPLQQPDENGLEFQCGPTTESEEADLSITKSDSPDPVVAGNLLTYTVEVTNAGPDTATNVVVTDTLPAGVTFSSASGDGWTCNEDGGVVTCTRASLAVGSAPDITINVTVNLATTGTIRNEVTVSAVTVDPDDEFNSVTEDTTVNSPEGEADLSITKSDDPNPVVAGNQLTYIVEVTNAGPDDATNVVVTDTLPAGVTFVSTSGCNNDSNGVPTCSLGDILSGDSAQYTITVTVDSGTTGTITNEVKVSADTGDPNNENNSVTEDTTVNPPLLSPGDVYVVMGKTGNDNPKPGSLATANLDTKLLTQVGPRINEVGGLSGLAIDSTGQFYVTAVGSPSTLIQVNEDGEILREIGTTTYDDGQSVRDVKIKDLSFRPEFDTLFGIGDHDSGDPDFTNALFAIDTSDATLVLLAEKELPEIKGIAFNPVDGLLYAVNNDGDGPTCRLTTIGATGGTSQVEVTVLDQCYDGLGIDTDGQIFGTTGPEFADSLHLIDPSDGSDVLVAGEGTNPSDVDFFYGDGDSPVSELKTTGHSGHESPTIGKASDGVRQIVENGMCIDAQCWTVTQPYHEEMELIQMLTSPHTISNTIFCNKGADQCNYIGIAFTTKDFDFNNPLMKVEAKKDHLGEWTISWYDPQDFIQDPDDAIPGEITFSAQIINDKFLTTSFTIIFKPKDTGELVIGIQVRDAEAGVRTFWFNEGVEFIDNYRYPYVETAFEAPLEVEPLCIGEDVYHRGNCAFDKVKEWATNNAEETMRQIMNNEYTYK